ncbi:DUF2808 domain-containing protein [Prochlorococcus marinus]|uniref:DUF2808 domain-containing protein n=1 Tax=Prochlorococcus marinus XMU1408 TaxID=2213228 RepID=A0A318R2J5_PROMR|nr:DUF2808 domain-containing protein [Prochlorococcus marinus]MBW3042419.1 hypothetical protein [Prochlorococcus marinus str. XMU1408]PYE01151.1 hypothetical protein DNJ73_06910 [Prochlorococcus marinus XMU1408]
MFKKQSFPFIKKVFFIGLSAFLFGTGAISLAPKSSASPGFFEYQWDPEPGYKQLKYYQSSNERNDRATYYFFLRGKERKEDIIKLTLAIPDYFDAKIKTKKLSLCKVKIGGYTERTRCLQNIPSLINVNAKQTSIEIVPEKPIPLNKDNYAVVMKIFNPRKRGMFQFRALSQQADDITVSTYLGTWNIDIQ